MSKSTGQVSTLQRRRARILNRSEVGIVTKYFLFFENFLMWLVGLAFTAIGTYILVIKEKKVRDAIDFFLDPACDMCLAGAVIFVISFLGCMGALRENTVFLKIFYYSLTLFLLGEIALAVIAFIFYYAPEMRDKIGLFPEKTLHDAIIKYRDDPDMQNLIDDFQKSLQCCGLSNDDHGYDDWNDNAYFNCTPTNKSPEACSVPPSCCILHPGQTINLLCGAKVFRFENGQRVENDLSRIYTKGCVKAVGDWINEHSLVIGGIMLGILLPQILVICISRNLIDQVKAQRRKWAYQR